MAMDADKGFEMRGSSRVRYGFVAGSLVVRRRFVFLRSSFVFCELLGSFRFFLFSGGLDFAEAVGGAVVGAVEPDFVAAEGFLGARRIAEGMEGEGGAGGWIFESGGAGLAGLLVGDADGFEGPDAEDTPAADGHGFDEVAFVLRGGLEAAGVGAEEGVKGSGIFAGEEDG